MYINLKAMTELKYKKLIKDKAKNHLSILDLRFVKRISKLLLTTLKLLLSILT